MPTQNDTPQAAAPRHSAVERAKRAFDAGQYDQCAASLTDHYNTLRTGFMKPLRP